MNKEHRLYWSLLLFALIRLGVSCKIELGVDEAHYVLYGRNLALSYFDHPPLVGWVQWIFQWPLQFSYFHDNPVYLNIFARLPAILLGFASGVLTDHWLRSKNYSKFERFWAVAGLQLCLLFMALSLFLLPDSFYLVLVPWLAIATDRLIEKKTIGRWLQLGLVLGLCALAKYTAILFVIPLLIIWIRNKYFKDLLTPGLWLGVLLAALCTAPILIWNWKMDFISFKYQSGHVMSWQNLDFKTFFGAQVSQLLGLGFFYAFALQALLAKRSSRPTLFTRLLLLIPLVFFSFFALFGNFLPHWTAPFFVLAIPLGIADRIRHNKGFTAPLKTAYALASVVFVLINAELIFHFAPPEISRHIYRDIQGWRAFTERALAHSPHPIAVTNWTFGSRIKLYADLAGRENTAVLDQRIDQFDLWQQANSDSSYLILIEKKIAEEFHQRIHCAEERSFGIDGPQFKGETLVEFEVFECVGLSATHPPDRTSE